MDYDELTASFLCHGAWLQGVLSVPTAAVATRGVLIVVGGPQYRAGSHRQFTLLARHLASAGVAAMRFDYRGMGDSEGATRSFDDTGDDIDAAVTHFMAAVPALREVVIWGLCDGASAALLYAPRDARVSALVLLNPWAHTEQGQARTVLRHYYLARLREPDFWRKLLAGRLRPGVALASLAQVARRAFGRADAATAAMDAGTLPQQLYQALASFRGRVLLLTCDPDLTAQEFLQVAASPAWQALLGAPRARHQRLAQADHTCSQQVWRDQVAQWTCEWVLSE